MGYPSLVHNMTHEDAVQEFELKVRLRRDVKHWLVDQAAVNANTQTSEVVRAVRVRMQPVQNKMVALLEAVR